MDRYPKRIVCLSEETTETLYLLGAEQRIAGISGFTPLISAIRWVSELIEIAGGHDIFAELQAEPLASGRIVQASEVAARDPQLILASWCGKMVKPERIRARPEFTSLAAVTAGYMFEIPSTIILQPGPASLTDGLAALHEHIARVANSDARER